MRQMLLRASRSPGGRRKPIEPPAAYLVGPDVALATDDVHDSQGRRINEDYARRAADHIPGAQLTLFRGGHMFFLFSQRHEALRRVEEFLADPGPPPPET
jgi:hypothetical protein